MNIKTRRPTGKPPFPLILLEGEEKAGKSLVPVVLSRSKRVGTTYWFDLGEGAADEYGSLPGADYVVVDHDGTYRDILEQLTAVHAEAARAAAAGEPPVVVVLDSQTALWKMLVSWTHERARASEGGQRKLEQDPNAEIDPTTNLWNDANKRHDRIMQLLRTFSGIAIVTARGKTVAKMRGGQPTGDYEWKVEGQKDLAFEVSVWIRMLRSPRTAHLIGVRSLRTSVDPDDLVDAPMTEVGSWSVVDLEEIVFGLLGCDESTSPRDVRKLRGDSLSIPERVAAARTLDELRSVWETARNEIHPEHHGRLDALVTERKAAIETEQARQEHDAPSPDEGPEVSNDPADEGDPWREPEDEPEPEPEPDSDPWREPDGVEVDESDSADDGRKQRLQAAAKRLKSE